MDNLFDVSLDTLLPFFPTCRATHPTPLTTFLHPLTLLALLSVETGYWTLWASRM
jgi:hypothetical protein